MSSVLADVDRSVDAIRSADPRTAEPFLGLILGSGLSEVVDSLEDVRAIPYPEIPGFPGTTVVGHPGELCVGTLDGVTVVCCRGRAHLYEGHDPVAIVHPIRTLVRLGARAILITNAAGGVNRTFKVGQLMLITDHVNLTGMNPLLGPNDPEIGPRFPDMSNVWDPTMSEAFRASARALGVQLPEGTYFGLLGPTYETPAEIRMIRTLGADAVGMSTVLEAIAARHMGCRIGGLSVISNLAAGDGEELDHAHVAEIADAAGPTFVALLRGLVERRRDWWEPT